MAVTLPYTTLGPGVVDAAQINANFAAIVTALTNIDNSNVKSSGGISIDKLSASYEYLPITVKLTDGTAANEQIVPVYNDSKGNWTVVADQWATANTGTPDGTCGYSIQWGIYNGAATPGAFTSSATIDTVALSGASIASQGIDSSPTTSTLTFGGGGVYRALRFYITSTNATCTSPIYITLLLKRQIAT